MKSFITLNLLVLALCMGQFSFAQEPIYKWGEPATNDYPERRIDQLLVLDNLGFVLLRKYTDDTFTSHYWIEHYTPDLKLEKNVPVNFNLGVMGDSYDIENILVAKDNIYAFVSHWDKSAGKNTLSIQALNLNGELNHLMELDVINATKMGNRGAFRLSLSPNKEQLVVLSEQPFVKKTNEKLRLSCFDLQSMSRLWSHDQELNILSSKALHNEVVMDNQGRVFIFKKDYNKAWYYYLYAFSEASKWQEFEVKNMDGLEVLDFKMGTDQSDDFFLYTTYTREPSAYKKYIHGYWYFALNNALEPKADVISSWSSDMVIHFGSERLAENTEKSRLEDFYVKDILLKDDGDLLILMEQLRSDKDIIEGSSPIKYTYEWNYGHFLAIDMNPNDGEIAWWQSFKKNQEVKSSLEVDEYGSFVYHLKEDRLYVLWNNTDLSVPSIPPANWTEPDGTKYVKHKAFDDKTVHGTFMQVIEPNGDLAYSDRKYGLPLFNLHNGAVFEMSMTTPFFFDYNGDLVILSTMHNGGKRFRFGFIGL